MVAKGYAHQAGLDYDQTYSPIVRLQCFRTALSHAMNRDMHIYQINVITAFLNGSIGFDIYMR